VFAEYSLVNCFRGEKHAREQEQEQFHQQKAFEEKEKMWNKDKPVPVIKAHGFYLVHESLLMKY